MNDMSISRGRFRLNIMAVCALLLAASALPTFGQEGGRGFAMRGIHENGTVRLRWASGSPVVWNLIRSGGVMLTRQAAEDSVPTVLNGGVPLRVWTADEWRANLGETPTAAQAATLLRDDEKERQGMTELAEADLEQNKLTSLLLMAEFNFDVARGLAFGYADREIRPGTIYRYRIIVIDPVHKDTLQAEAFVRSDDEEPLAPVAGVKGAAGDRYIDLWWDRTPVHSGYWVERRPKGGSSWTRLNKQPLLFADNYPSQRLYRDSVPNDNVYEYRVLGTDAFGRESGSSNIAEASARDMTPPQPPYDVQWEKTKDGVRITWKNPTHEPDLAGYGLLRSTQPDDGYTPVHSELLPPKVISYSDVLPEPGTYFYRLISVDTAGNLSAMSVRAMAIVEDSTAPPSPLGLNAVADTNGLITVRWNHRPEGDVAGYRIYRMVMGGNEPEFVPLNPGASPDTVFVDTLMATVRDRFYYRVRAVDFAGNYSAPSEPIGVQFPDHLPPVPPLIDDYSTADRRVRIRYASPSVDVAGYEVRRARSGGSGVGADFRLRLAGREWSDSTAEHGVEYQYVVVAIDSAGNVSEPSTPLFVKPFWTKELTAPGSPRVDFDGVSKQVRVAWSFPQGNGWSAVVFRKTSTDGTFLQLSPAITENSYVDPSPKPGRNEYALRFYYPEQGGTPLGTAAGVDAPGK